MLLSEFCLSAIEHIQQKDYGVKTTVRLYTDGFTSSNPRELSFIHTSNIKYHNTESDTLIGNYFDISYDHEGTTGSMCRIEASYLMGVYLNGGWSSVDRVVQANLDQARLVDTSIMNYLHDYDKVRDHIILRPIAYEQNRAALKGNAYRMVGDIALALYVKVQDDGKNLTTAKIPNEVAADWNVSLEDAFSNAMENTAFLYPPRIYLSALDVINPPYMRGVFMGDGEGRITKIDKSITATITTTRQVNGALAVFYPGVIERIAELYGGSYYVAFTSDSEARLHSTEVISAWQVYKALKNSNRRFRSTMMTNAVYQCDTERKALLKLDF